MKAVILFMVLLNVSMASPVDKLPILKIGRSTDLNEVHYFVNVDKNGELNSKEPLKLLWKNHKKGGAYEDLNWIKKKYGYGVKPLDVAKDKVTFKFVSYDKKQFYLHKNKEGKYAIFGTFENKEVELQDFFVNIKGGGFWTPNVVSISLKGEEVDSHKAFASELKP